MRKFLLAIAIFCGGELFAQSHIVELLPSEKKEPARQLILPRHKPQLEEGEQNRYLRDVEWVKDEIPQPQYRAICNIPFAWANRQILLRIEHAPAPFSLYVGDRFAGRVQTGAVACEFNLTKLMDEGRNELLLKLDTESEFSSFEDFFHPSDIGTTQLISQPTIRIRDVITTTQRVAQNVVAEVAIAVKCDALNRKSARVHYELLSPSGIRVKSGRGDLSLGMRGEDTLRFTVPIEQDSLWSIDTALFYTLKLSTQTLSRYTEYVDLKLGFRTLECRDGALIINGRKETLKGYRVDRRLSAEELAKIKADGYNLLYPLPGYSTDELYAMADTIGLYVVAQAPLCSERSGSERTKGGNPSNDPELRLAAIERSESMYHTSKQHPSVIALSIAYNSSNGISLYESYLNMKRIERTLPIIYREAEGEWNSDNLIIE